MASKLTSKINIQPQHSEHKSPTAYAATLNQLMLSTVHLLCNDCSKESRAIEHEKLENGKTVLFIVMCDKCLKFNTHIRLAHREHIWGPKE